MQIEQQKVCKSTVQTKVRTAYHKILDRRFFYALSLHHNQTLENMKGLILTIAMTVVSMVSYSQLNEKKALLINRITEPPVNQWYYYGDGVRLCFEGSDANKAFDHLMKTRASDEPTEFVKYLDPYTGEFFEVEIHRTDDDRVVFFQIGYRVIITLNEW